MEAPHTPGNKQQTIDKTNKPNLPRSCGTNVLKKHNVFFYLHNAGSHVVRVTIKHSATQQLNINLYVDFFNVSTEHAFKLEMSVAIG